MINNNKFSKGFFILAILALVLLAPSSVEMAQAVDKAPSPSIGEITRSIQARYENILTFCADFTQDTFQRALDETETVTGRVYFEKPGKMRWDYDNKEKVIGDGEFIWLYQPELGQVIESTVEESTPNLAMDFLSGVGNLSKDFHVKSAPGPGGGLYRLELTPKKAMSNVKTLFIDVNKEYLLVSTIVMDPFGNETTVTFSDITTGTAKEGKSFEEGFFGIGDIKGARVVRP